MGVFKLLEQNHLSSALTPINIRELVFLEAAPCDIWIYQDEQFKIFLSQHQDINREHLKEALLRGSYWVFVSYDQYKVLLDSHQQKLRNVTRSISIGDPLNNGKLLLSLLTVHLGHVYRHPTDDQALSLQYQSAKNLISFLINNEKIIAPLYKNFSQQKHYYTLSQPMLSSLMLAAFLKSCKHFSEREIENLFITSYFKDIGMAFIPTETIEKKDLSPREESILVNHPQTSVDILTGRIPLNPNYLNIIGHHHDYSLGKLKKDNGQAELLVKGLETFFVTIMDMITAMISDRPYRKKMPLFDALKMIKDKSGDDYPQEFKEIVQFLRKFYKSIA